MLSDGMILSLSRSITEEDDLRTLATIGLKIEDDVIDSHISTEKNISLATRKVIKDWRKKQINSKTAYSNLCDTLERVEMSYYIDHVLMPLI